MRLRVLVVTVGAVALAVLARMGDGPTPDVAAYPGPSSVVYLPAVMAAGDDQPSDTATPTPTWTAMPALPTVTPTQTPVPIVWVTATPTDTPTAGGGLTLPGIDGRAWVLASDGTYHGIVSSNQFASDSICNKFGTYGSAFSTESIRDSFGDYGSPFSPLSAYDPYTTTPPLIVYNNVAIAYLTKNTLLYGGIDPDVVFAAYGCS